MKKIIIFLFILSACVSSSALAMTVGGPEMTVPEESLFLKEEAVKKALDRYEYAINIKSSLDIEVVTKTKLTSSPEDVASAEIEGHSFMLKFSNNFNNIIEPYVKLGTSTLDVEWFQHGRDVKVESETGLVWGAGVKAKIWELKDYGVSLTLDAQYRDTSLGVDKAKVGSSAISPRAEDFNIKEWQISLLGSKKLIVPIGKNDYYIVPYGGLTLSTLDVDISFWDDAGGRFFSTYNASADNEIGIVLGCDIMPFFLSYYLLSFELRLLSETALTIGGTVKF